jgi:hypothetical protein
MVANTDISILQSAGYHVYPQSYRRVGALEVLVVSKNGLKRVALRGKGFPSDSSFDDAGSWRVQELDWPTYMALGIKPEPINRAASFGTGDRMGMVTAAHLSVHSRYPVFPILAQQSPRELERTGRTFKRVLLDAVLGVLESGYTGSFGADADHVKDPVRLKEGIDAGYSMFTLDLSENLRPAKTGNYESLSSLSKDVVDSLCRNDDFDKADLIESAIIYEKSMESCVNSYQTIHSAMNDFDLEVSIDEGDRNTTLEDHAYTATYLHKAGVVFTSIAPRFPGEFQKAVDYRGDLTVLSKAFQAHADLAANGGYRLSLHSGSDKFSVYPQYAKATKGLFHIKTSGTSWLQAVRVVVEKKPAVFEDMYKYSVAMLEESRKAYHVDIREPDFPRSVTGDRVMFYSNPNVQQLIHISYGVLLQRFREPLREILLANEELHYKRVAEHIERHHQLAFGA